MNENMTSVEKDTISRNRIVSETDMNFFVEAGAGSGKTTMLVSRMVAMVEQGKDISKICAITFTKAAAGEFYERFQKMLIERSNPDFMCEDKGFSGQLPTPTEETRERCANALQNIDLCFMGTIDSFCNMVLSEHPSEAKIPSDATIMSDVDVQALYKQIYVKICDGGHGEELRGLSRTYRTLHRNAEEVFIKGISIFMNNRNVHFNYNESQAADLDKDFATERANLIKALGCLIDHPELMYDANQQSVAAWGKLSDAYKNIKRRWSDNYSGVLYALKSIKDIRVLPRALDKYAPSLADVFEPGGKQGKWLELTSTKDKCLYDKMKNLQYGATMTFLSKCVPVIEQAMREKGCLTFFDYLYYLRNMLKEDAGKNGDLIRYIYNRHSYFLIDEFQDTNPMQAEVFFYLASQNPVEIWSKCVPRPGSLFIVGDPKQSIYRFRSADVTSFLNVKKLFRESVGDVLYLSRNFRSTKQLLGYFNRVFTQMLPEENENQSKFEEIPLPDSDRDEFQGIYTYRAYTGSAAPENPSETDPMRISSIITTLVDRDEYLITTGDDKEPRKIKYGDIMVITYGKKKLAPIMQRLDELEIPMHVEGDVPFYSNEALYAIYQIYSAVADSDDKLSLLGALTGKILNFHHEDVVLFKAYGGEVSMNAANELAEDAEETALLVAEKVNELKQLHYRALKLSPAALFAEIMDKYEVYRYAKADNLEVLYYTLELMRNAESNGIIVSATDGANYLAGLLAGESEEERCLSLNDTRDCVHMANLHKIKGLEAPIVILAAASSREFTATERMEHGDDSSEGYIFKLEGDRNENGSAPVYFETSDYADKKDEENAALKAEGQRLVYVAATRARNALILCDSVHFSGKGGEVHDSKWKPIMESDTPDFFDATKNITEKIRILGESVESSLLYDKAKEECVLNDRTSENSTFELKNPSKTRVSSKLADETFGVIVAIDNDGNEIVETEDNKVAEAHRLPILLGTMTHRLMEMIIATKGTYDTSKAIEEIIREYRTQKNQPYEKELKDALSTVAKTMLNGGYDQENGVPKDIVNVLLSAEECYTEVPFCYRETEGDDVTIWNGVMDVIYKKDGIWHIVDYKTNVDGKGLDAKYKGQLAAYVKAFQKTTDETVADALTYHIDI